MVETHILPLASNVADTGLARGKSFSEAKSSISKPSGRINCDLAYSRSAAVVGLIFSGSGFTIPDSIIFLTADWSMDVPGFEVVHNRESSWSTI